MVNTMQRTIPQEAGEAQLSIIGLGKLGSPMVAVFAHKGCRVIGVDTNQDFVNAIANGRSPVREPGVQELIDQCRDRITATTDYKTAIQGSDVTFIIVPTPSSPNHTFSNKYVIASLTMIGEALRTKSGYHLVVVTSTVMPGSTGGELQKALEQASGRKVGAELGLCYNPEFIALGSVVRDMLHPDLILIGESDAKAGQMLAELYMRSTNNSPPIHRMNFVNAELSKISINTYVTTKISYANMLAELCDHLDGADAEVVTRTIGDDSRIGRKYLTGAIGYGGPCFPRDNRAFAALGQQLGVHVEIALATDQINQHQINRLVGAVESLAQNGATIAVLGMSYKPDTPVIENSQGLHLAKCLHELKYQVVIYDPGASDAAHAVLGPEIQVAKSAQMAVSLADVIVITTPWPEFRNLKGSDFSAAGRQRIIIDPWRIIAADAGRSAHRHIIMGRGGTPGTELKPQTVKPVQQVASL